MKKVLALLLACAVIMGCIGGPESGKETSGSKEDAASSDGPASFKVVTDEEIAQMEAEKEKQQEAPKNTEPSEQAEKEPASEPPQEEITPEAGDSEFTAFSDSKFQDALDNNKVILLFFNSVDCEECPAQQTIIEDAIEEVNLADVIAFNVDFDLHEDVKEQYEVEVHNTKVFITKEGEKDVSAFQELDKETIKQKLELLAKGITVS